MLVVSRGPVRRECRTDFIDVQWCMCAGSIRVVERPDKCVVQRSVCGRVRVRGWLDDCDSDCVWRGNVQSRQRVVVHELRRWSVRWHDGSDDVDV